MTKEEIKAWLLAYAWLGTPEQNAAEVDCIMAQDDWEYVEERADRFAGAQFEPGPKEFETGMGLALSELYECHDGPHTRTCPRRKDEWPTSKTNREE